MRKLQNIAIFGMIAAILSVSLAAAAPTAAEVKPGNAGAWSGIGSAGNVNIYGGNITQVNVSAYQVTDKWVGFWGEVSSGITLRDSAGNIFYQWTISDPTGSVVYACNGTVSSWSDTNIKPLYANNTLLPQFLREGTDSFNNTFIYQGTFKSPSLTINNVNYTYTWQGNSEGNTFATYALYSETDNVLIWAGNVTANQQSFKGGSVTADYQILAGVDEQGAAATFYFYLELAS